MGKKFQSFYKGLQIKAVKVGGNDVGQQVKCYYYLNLRKEKVWRFVETGIVEIAIKMIVGY